MRLSVMLLCLQLWGNVDVSLSQNACSELPEVPHAHVSDETRKAEYNEGHVILFTCEVGYISFPASKYVCTNQGWLAVHKGSCSLKPCQLPDDTQNGHYQIIHGDDFVFGTTIKYFCNEGYQMVSKEDTRSCILDGWTNHVPICDPLSCDLPPAAEALIVKGLPDNDDPILPDRFLTFSCEGPGKILDGSSLLICGKDGQWNNPFPTCEDITCTASVMHPHLHAAGLNETLKVGHKLQFHCDSEYVLDGPEEIRCLQSGQWSAPFPTCIDKCRITGVPDSVNIVSYPPGRQLTKGQKLKFICRLRSHTLRGVAEVTCLADGHWSHPFPTCGVPLDCERPPALLDGDTRETLKFRYSHNERVEFICQNYYTMEGGPFKTCNNGEWTGEMRCLKPCTVDSDAMSKRNIKFRYRRNNKLYSAHNDVIEFVCTTGRQVGTVGMRQRCVNGEINLPSCHN